MFRYDKPFHPVRYYAAQAVYWLIWGPFFVLAIPVAVVSGTISWIEWEVKPFVGRYLNPLPLVHSAALFLGQKILGPRTDLAA